MKPIPFARCLISLALAPLLALSAHAAGGKSQPDQAPPLPLLVITLAPGGVDARGAPTWVDVTTRISGMEWQAGEPFLRIPVKFAGVPAVAYGVSDLSLSDASGPIPLRENLDEPDAGGFLYFRRWSAGRDVAGDVSLSYRAPIELRVPELGAGPPFDLRADGGGFSGAGNNFLVVPDTAQPFRIRIDWRLDQLSAGSIGVSSFGEGATDSPGPVDRLTAGYFMAGPLGRYPSEGGDTGFTGYWVGAPRFDAGALLAWSERAYRAIAEFFEDADPPPFRVLMRGNPYEGGGGAALISSFLVSYPATKDDAATLRETIAHETVHNWVSSIGGPPGSTSWFSEGMTVAYTRRLLLASGLFTPDEFLESVNETALGYYTNALNDLPNDEIAKGFWSDTRVRSLPYSRGSLYFASVDSAVREHSGGARSLDHLLKAFLARSASGEAVTAGTWRDLIRTELGAAGETALDAMLAGELVVPPEGSFGPCFTRETVRLRRFELGFDRSSLFSEPRIVAGLEPASAAARAGLREGDRILHPVALEDAQNQQDRTLQLRVRRADEELEIEYLPRGETVRGYQWVRVSDVSNAHCAF
jgi:hypothetical protein